MNSAPKQILLSFLFLLPSLGLFTQPGQYLFQHLTVEDGLPINAVSDALEDQQGFLWLATSNGLVRYDGDNLRVFTHDVDDSLSISNSFIGKLHEDRWGFLWISTTGGGLNKYDPKTETFRAYKHNPKDPNSLPSNTIHAIMEDDLGHFWVGTDKGLSKVTLSQGPDREPLFFQNIIQGEDGLSNAYIKAIFQDKARHIWVGTNHGLNRLPPPKAQEEGLIEGIEQYTATDKGPNPIVGNLIHSIFQSEDGLIWIGTGTGLQKLVISATGELGFQTVLDQYLGSQTITDIIQDQAGQLWVSIFGAGLLQFNYSDTSTIALNHLRHLPEKRSSLSGDKVYFIYPDKNGLFWVGTAKAGLSYFDPSPQAFQYIEGDYSAIAMLEDRKGFLWVGTERNGLIRINQLSGKQTAFKAGYPNLYSNLITEIFEDQTGNLWLGSFRGLNVWAKEDRERDTTVQFKHYRAQPDSHQGLSDRRVFAIHEYPVGVYWIGTRGQGLNRLTFTDGDWDSPYFMHYKHDPSQNSISDDYVWAIEHDAQGQLWVGTDKGVNKIILNAQHEPISFQAFRNKPQELNSLSTDLIGPILCSEDSIIWVGTAGEGLNKLDFRQDPTFEQPTISRYNINNGLPDNSIYSIIEDKNGFLWLSTNRGLSRFNPNFNPQGGQQKEDAFTNFFAKDGLQADEFNTNAFTKSPRSQQLFFGGQNGITHFSPDSLDYGLHPPKLSFTDFRLFNQAVPIAGEGSPLSRSISRSSDLKLSYKDDMISFEFAAMDFRQPTLNQYAYKLEGYSEDWIYLGNENSVHFTNLDPGEYQLVVKGSNSRGIWNHSGASIRFSISPPPWRSWWAYLLYALLFGAVLYFFIQSRIRQGMRKIEEANRLAQARYEERESLRKQNAADYHDELGHRLTKISLFLELAQRQSDSNETLERYLDKIKSNTQDLSDGIRDLIWSLDPAKDSLYETLLRLQAFGDKLFDYSDTAFQTKGIAEASLQIQLGADQRRHLLLLFKEAMHNCLKYAKAGVAKLDIESSSGQIKIIFQDNGIGFDHTKSAGGYGLKNMEERAKKIGGALGITSVGGEGTVISLLLQNLSSQN